MSVIIPWTFHTLCIILLNRKRRSYIDDLKKGVFVMAKTILYTHMTGNNVGSLHFLWKVPEEAAEEDLLAGNLAAQRAIKSLLPLYHTRAMRRQFFQEFGLFRGASQSVLREMYHRLTGKVYRYRA